MKNILFYECRRVASKKLILIVLLLSFGCSIISCLWGDISFTSQRKQVYETVENLSTNDEKLAVIQNEYHRLSTMYSALIEELHSDINAVVDFSLDNSITGDIVSESTLYGEVLPEFEMLADYKAYLDGIEQNAVQMGTLSLFADSNSFESKVIAETPSAYEHLRDTQIKIEFPDGAESVTQNNFLWTGLIFAVVFSTTLFYEDMETGSARVIRATRNGRNMLLTVRLFVLILSSFFVGLMLVGGPFLVNLLRWGLGDLGKPIQSLPAFYSSPLKITVGGYYLLQICAIAIAVFITEIITAFVCNLLGNSVAVYAAMIGVQSLETISFLFISRNSVLNLLKYINLISFCNIQTLFSNFWALNIVGRPVSLQIVLLVAIPLLLLIPVILLYHLSFTREPIHLTLPKFLQREKKFHFSLLPKETYRLFITQKAVFVLAILMVVQWYSYTSFAPVYDQDDLRLRSYISAINGKLDDAGLIFIAEQEKYYDNLYEALNQLDQRYQDGKLSEDSYQITQNAINQQLAGRTHFETFKSEAERLLSEGKSVFLYRTGYELIFGNSGAKTVAMQGILAMIFISLALSGIYAVDNESGFARLLSSTKRGRGYLLSRKLALAGFVSIIVTLSVYVPYIFNILDFYGDFQILESVQLLKNFPIDISILWYIFLLMIFRAGLCGIASCVVTWISRKSQTVRSSLIVSLLVTVLPAALCWVTI